MALKRRVTSRDLQIFEVTDELLQADVPEPPAEISLLRGFNATIPSSEASKTRRRQMRNVDTPRLSLKKLSVDARGLLQMDDAQSVASSEDDVVVIGPHAGKGKKRLKRGRESLSTAKMLGTDELLRQTKEIMRDKENLHVRRSLINSEINEITNKIEALDNIRARLQQDLLKLQEDELELDDELEGVKERMGFEQSASLQTPTSQLPTHAVASRRRRGPVFLPSEHDELPPGVAFMSFDGHSSPVTALDFSEPYGTLVSASKNEPDPIVCDLFSGSEMGRLRGHSGGVKCIQVEDTVCVTGGCDGDIRVWDLSRVDDDDGWGGDGELVSLPEESEDDSEDRTSPLRQPRSQDTRQDSCVRRLSGHTKAVTALYYEDECLVTGASDKTLRQWDLTTGQCVMTMDILWEIAHPASGSRRSLPDFIGGSAAAGAFAMPTPPSADGSWEMYEDFVGGVQFWGYGLVSGSGDGVVRMWDMRTGQSHRTLMGHTGPVTCLQFDEMHIASGSLDKTLRIWDLRTGGTLETLHYDHAVTALQFDTRKVVAAAGENGVKVYNRTSMQHSTLQMNGHTRPVECLRYMDRYLVSGGRDFMIKIWSL
ncbi:WD40 repeat-like protein [Fistulina hepatica ATCC 64428]|uniref:WD40 repeat-like protein n=1 Tax=Fistulina hepatica ATCC 64428 TaxID=1128425 RepID=A0A0D7A353_9AGAR|nr:WD40 repeat-like protein [Fistulina hepatica ATCC 64428]